MNNINLCSRNLVGSKQLFPPLPTDSLKATDYITADFTGLSVLESAIPVAPLDPSRSLFATFFFPSDISNKFSRRPEPP